MSISGGACASMAMSVGQMPAKSASQNTPGLNGQIARLLKPVDGCDSGGCPQIGIAKQLSNLMDGNHPSRMTAKPDPHSFIIVAA